MKFIHIADLHLGMEPDRDKPWSKSRGRELWDAFSNVIGECQKGGVELLLIAGDLFHKQPLVRELKEAAGLLASISDTEVVLIAGNHDYISGTSGYRNFKWPENVHFLMEDKPGSVYLENINTEVFGFSYHVRNIFDPLYDGLRPEDPSRINILLGHGGEPSNIPIDWKRLEHAGFDYIAMGHLHKPVDISERIRYAGSLEPLDKNESGRHGYITGEIFSKENAPEENALGVKAPGANAPEEGYPARETGRMAECGYVTASGHEVRTARIACAKRSYIKADIELTCEDTYGSLRRKVMKAVEDAGSENYYVLRLFGEYDPDIVFDLEGLDDLGLIAGITDETRPKLDYDRLEAENVGNVIGMFISRLKDDENDDETVRKINAKALYYGVMALNGKL